MSEIPDIEVRDISIPYMPPWAYRTTPVTPLEPPVTVNIGFPIVDIPGCVEWHPDDKRAGNLPLEDNDGVKTLCPNGQYPSYNAMDYTPENLIIVEEAAPPTYSAPEAPSPPTPNTDIPDIPKQDVECPGANAPRIGDVAQNKKEKVSGFELSDDGQTCIVLYTEIGAVEQFLPAPQVVSTTAVIATVATTSALLAKPLADLLLKVVMPVVKKAIGTIQTKLFRKPPRLTRSDLIANRYREKRGLLPLKPLKKKPLKKAK